MVNDNSSEDNARSSRARSRQSRRSERKRRRRRRSTSDASSVSSERNREARSHHRRKKHRRSKRPLRHSKAASDQENAEVLSTVETRQLKQVTVPSNSLQEGQLATDTAGHASDAERWRASVTVAEPQETSEPVSSAAAMARQQQATTSMTARLTDELSICLPFFTHGIATTILSLTPIGVPLWNQTGLILGAAISGPIMCYVIDRCGRKIGIFIVNLVQGTTCIPLFLIPNPANVLTIHILTGISAGGLFTILPIYLKEVTPMKIRAIALSLMTVMVSAGYLMKLAMSTDEMMLTVVALVMLQLLTLSIMVESPCYLIIVDKVEAAHGAVAKLKSLPKDSPGVAHDVNMLKQESERARANGKITLFSFFKNRIWLDITKIGIILFTSKELCGSIIFLDQDKTLAQLKLPSDPDEMLVIVAWCVGCVFCMLVIKFVERRYILTFGYVVMVLSMGVLGVYTQSELTVKTLRWLPVVTLPILVFGYGVAWGMPTIIMVEMYNFEIRATLIGFIYAYSELIKLLHVHTFQYIEDYMGTYTVFYIFACINLLAGVYALFAIPDIKDKSVRQIERQLKRIPILK